MKGRKISSSKNFPNSPFTMDRMESSDLSDLVRDRLESLGMDTDACGKWYFVIYI